MNKSQRMIYKEFILQLTNSRSLLPRFFGVLESDEDLPDWKDYCFASWVIGNKLFVERNTPLIESTLKKIASKHRIDLKPSALLTISKQVHEFVIREYMDLIEKHGSELKNKTIHLT